MRKPKKNSITRIKRTNQKLRKRALKANKHKAQSFVKKTVTGKTIVNDKVQPVSKALWPNQAQP